MHFLIIDHQTRLGRDGMSQRFGHLVYRIVTHEALDKMSRVEIDHDPDSTTVALHQPAVWRDGAWQDRLAFS